MEPLANYIRTEPYIKGFSIRNSTHTISLFADDIILMLTEVEDSLTSVHSALQMFNKVYYYKVNEGKSYILGLGIDSSMQQSLSLWFPYRWSDGGIKYLGITLMATMEELIEANYAPFLNTIKVKLQDITRMELSWSGRLAAFKMVLLPQLLCLLRTLPIPVANSFFNKIQSLVNQYLWKGKTARCAFKKLIVSRRVGGVGQVSIKNYYIASILAQFRKGSPNLPGQDGKK